MEPKRTPARDVYGALAFLMTALFLTVSLHAQETRARITGRVTDTTKAAISGASVKVTDTARGTTTSSTTNSEGLFQVNYLLPGTYAVEVEVTGFKKHVKDKVQLQINETRDLAIVLEVGGVEETVSVTAEGAALNSTDANLGLTVDQKRLSELPLIHGDPYKIMGLAPGLAHSGDQRLDRPYEPTVMLGTVAYPLAARLRRTRRQGGARVGNRRHRAHPRGGGRRTHHGQGHRPTDRRTGRPHRRRAGRALLRHRVRRSRRRHAHAHPGGTGSAVGLHRSRSAHRGGRRRRGAGRVRRLDDPVAAHHVLRGEGRARHPRLDGAPSTGAAAARGRVVRVERGARHPRRTGRDAACSPQRSPWSSSVSA